MEESILSSRLEAIGTRWSLVQQAHTATGNREATAARQALVLRYAKAIRRYVGGIVRQSDDADELAQDVVMRLMKGDFAGADPTRGRFRDLLKTAVRNMVHNHWDKSNRRKTKDAELDTIGKEEVDPAWDNEWQMQVLELAWAGLKEFEKKNPTNPAHTLLKLRAANPEDTSEELAQRLSKATKTTIRADACRQMLRRARLRFAEILVTELGVGLADPSPARVAEELAALGLLEYVKDFMPENWASSGVLQE
jgi:RNA polymerase sigma factor (sigma-70 family)